jgi:hypothetical protein
MPIEQASAIFRKSPRGVRFLHSHNSVRCVDVRGPRLLHSAFFRAPRTRDTETLIPDLNAVRRFSD